MVYVGDDIVCANLFCTAVLAHLKFSNSVSHSW